jgi:hypothetical protein
MCGMSGVASMDTALKHASHENHILITLQSCLPNEWIRQKIFFYLMIFSSVTYFIPYYLIIHRLALTKSYQVLLQLSDISANAGLPFPSSYFLRVSFVNANFPLGKKFRVLKRAIAALVFMHMAKNTQAD